MLLLTDIFTIAGVRWKVVCACARGKMDNLLQQFEICFSSPEDYLDGNIELRNSCLQLNEELFSQCYDKTGRFPTGPLCGLDIDQIWEKIQSQIIFYKKKIENFNINFEAGESDREEESTSDDMMDEPIDQHLSKTVEDGQLSSHQKQQQKVFNRSLIQIICVIIYKLFLAEKTH